MATEPGLAEVKAAMAAANLDADVHLDLVIPREAPMLIAVTSCATPATHPECVAGVITCGGCSTLCWVSAESIKLVLTAVGTPWCETCLPIEIARVTAAMKESP